MNHLFSLEQALRIRDAYVGLRDDISAFLMASGEKPAPGSQAACERAEPGMSEHMLTVFAQGSLLLESAADHCHALTQTLVEPISTMVPWTLVRAGLESAALSCWLMSYSIDRRERLSRSLAFQYEGLYQQLKLANSCGNYASVDKGKVQIQSDKVLSNAAALGYPPVLDKHGGRLGQGSGCLP